jgi:hypothetical protein
MPSANKTPNYNLTQYSNNGSDKVAVLKDYNEDMSKIDIALNNNANNIAINANNITTKADAATTYSKTDVDAKISAKADSATTYSKTDVDDKLQDKLDLLIAQQTNNAVYLGADNTGTSVVSDIIQSVLDSGKDLFFPAGVYLVDKPITMTNRMIYCDKNAVFKANNALTSMFVFHSTNITTSPCGIYGGCFNGKGLAQSVCTGDSEYTHIKNAYICNFTGINLDLTQQHGAIVSDVYIADSSHSTTAISTHFDSQFSNIRIWGNKVGIKTTGMNIFENIYMWADEFPVNNTTIGFDCENADIRGTDIYIDGYTYAFNAPTNGCRLSIFNFLYCSNYNQATVDPIMYNCATNSQIIVYGQIQTNSSRRFNISPKHFTSFCRLGTMIYGTNLDGFESQIIDPQHYYYSLNLEVSGLNCPAAEYINNVPPQNAIALATTSTPNFSAMSIRNAYGDFYVETVLMNNLGNAYERELISKYSWMKLATAVDNGTATLYIVNTDTVAHSMGPYEVMFKNGARNTVTSIVANANTTYVPLPANAVFIP